MIVRMIVAVMLVVVDVDVSSLGGGGGSTAPGEWIIPANAETVSVKLRAAIAPIWRNLRTFVALLRVIENFASAIRKGYKIFNST